MIGGELRSELRDAQGTVHHATNWLSVEQSAVGSLHAALGLAGVRAQDLDVQLGQRTAELRHARAALRILLAHAKHSVLVGVEGGRASMGLQIAIQRFEIGCCTLAGNEA
jgi:hypothetical protein